MPTGATTLMLISPIAGKPQGVAYDFVRNQFGLQSAYAPGSANSEPGASQETSKPETDQ